MAKLHSFKTGDEIPGAVIAVAVREKISTAGISGVGGVDRLRLAYFNDKTKKYEEHDFDEFLEVTSFLGNVTIKDGKPFLHAHGTFGRKDLSVIGGHIISARVKPILELTIQETKNTAFRKFDDETGLNVIYKTS